MLLIGIDLGTSAVKLLLMDENGAIHRIVSREYPLEFPQPGWSQQAPEDWWNAVCDGLPELLEGFDASQVRAVVGPSISQAAFEVGDEVAEAFAKAGFSLDQVARRMP